MTASDLSTAYIDTRDLEPRKDACPFRGCAARLETAPYRRKLLPCCPMANQLGVEWTLVNLVSERQHSQGGGAGYADPTAFMHSVLSQNHRHRFVRYSWERLYSQHVRDVPQLADPAAYMRYKSANCLEAFGI